MRGCGGGGGACVRACARAFEHSCVREGFFAYLAVPDNFFNTEDVLCFVAFIAA